MAFFQLSGGSTGVPKLIPRTHDDYIYSLRGSAEICGLDAASVYLAALPVAHNFPLSSPGTLGTLYAGGTVVIARNPSPDEVFPLIERERVTITALVPPLALIWLEAAAARRPDLSSLKVLQVGGAKFAAEAAARVRPVLGCTLQQVFGMAEGLVNYTRLDDPDDIVVNTQGRPISPDDEVHVVDDDDRPVEPGEVGHLLTRGPYTIRGYYNAPEHNARAFTPDGFYRTGDLVRRDAAGYLTVEGRAKDQINRGGDKVAAEEVENHILAHPAVMDAAVVAMPDAFLGERSCAFVIPRGPVPPRGPRSSASCGGAGWRRTRSPTGSSSSTASRRRGSARSARRRCAPPSPENCKRPAPEESARERDNAMAIPTIASYPMPGPADVPQSKVSWKPDARRAVLLIHDMQEYFLDFYNVADAPIPELISNIRRIREHCTALGIPVVYTAQPAEQSAEHRGLLQDMWGDGLPSRPHRQPVVAELAPGPDDVVLTKWRYSAFQRSDLAERMRGWKRDQLIVCGIYAHIGCMMTACDAFMNDIQPFLVADALADFSAENHRMALTWVAQRCGVATSTADLLANLGGAAGKP